MDKEGCNCGDKDGELTCQTCDKANSLPYWCETCEHLVPEKRCLNCGLKARKVRCPSQKQEER